MSKNAVSGHQKVHKLTYIKPTNLSKSVKNRSNSAKQTYSNKPNKCKQCKTVLSYEKRKQSFCNSSCAATYNNTKRIRSNKSKQKTAQTLSQKAKAAKPIQHQNLKWAEGPFSRITFKVCVICSNVFATATQQAQVCNNCFDKVSFNREGRRLRKKYAFTFKIENFPDLFNLANIQKIGWYIPKLNPTGLTRDHKVSVADAIRNNYDPFYIKHPLNCEIMTHQANVQKHTRSSISYEELKILVDNFAPREGLEPPNLSASD
jgi:hypothetical protein